MARHVIQGDTVIVTAGRDKGKTGKVLRVIPDVDRVVVEGINRRVKHLKPGPNRPQGGVIEKEMPIHMSNVSPLVDGKPSRVRFETKDDGSKTRVAVRNGKELHTLRKAQS